jgi:Cephalosporin hydroxylase
MYQFWNNVVAPVIEAAGARRIVEVGAPRSENTKQMLDRLGPDVELHVIDPLPALDPAEHEARRVRTRCEFEAFASLVPVGSYLIVEHTVVTGFPVDASFGPAPHEALRRLMNLHGEFLADTTREPHALTFNQGGFLKRIA